MSARQGSRASCVPLNCSIVFFFNDTATTEIYTLSLHDALPIEAMTPAEARAQMEATAQSRKAEPLPVARVEERMIPGPAGNIRLRLYWPQASAPRPAIVYYHGGGHVIGSLDTHDFVARNLCAGTEAVVASVDYRMGPEHKFPAAVDDSFAAVQWVHANARSLGADS